MGFTFRKSFKLPGGFRVNLSKGGVGVSVGVAGFRVGVGPSGGRVSAGIPGTGLGYTHTFSLGSHPGGRPRAPSDVPANASAENAQQVARHQEHVARLTGMHRSAWRPWDWATVAATPPPS